MQIEAISNTILTSSSPSDTRNAINQICNLRVQLLNIMYNDDIQSMRSELRNRFRDSAVSIKHCSEDQIELIEANIL